MGGCQISWKKCITKVYGSVLGAMQVLRNADGGGGCQIFGEKALRRCKVQCYLRYEGVGGGPISRKKRYVTLEWPLISVTRRWVGVNFPEKNPLIT